MKEESKVNNKGGRPKKKPDGKIIKHFKVRLTKQEAMLLSEYATENNRSTTNQVELLIQQFTKREG